MLKRPPDLSDYEKNTTWTVTGTVDEPETPLFCRFSNLLAEIQEDILIKAGVSIMLSNGSFAEVHSTVVPVCKYWKEILSEKLISGKIIRIASSIDPMCRYLKTAQRVHTDGLQFDSEPSSYRCAVTMGDKLYVTEMRRPGLPAESHLRLCVYDLVNTHIRHEDPHQRKMTFSNPAYVEIPWMTGDVSLLIPCPRTDCLYAFESGNVAGVTVHKLKTDGTQVFSRTPPVSKVRLISLDPTGAKLALVTDDSTYVYETTTGYLRDMVHKQELVDGMTKMVGCLIGSRQIFLSARMKEVLKQTWYAWNSGGMESRTFDDPGFQLDMGRSCIMLIGSGRRRELLGSVIPMRRTDLGYHWYDRARGLIFCMGSSGLMILRITY